MKNMKELIAEAFANPCFAFRLSESIFDDFINARACMVHGI
jgi:hypothetical protein